MCSCFQTLNDTPAHSLWGQVASAMKYLHTRSPAVVHRDLKPQNVLLDDHHDAKARGQRDSAVAVACDVSRDDWCGVRRCAILD